MVANKNILSQYDGVTLTEVIIAAVMVTIVMAGVISTDVGLRKVNQDLTDEAEATLTLVPMMNHVLDNMLKAEGSSTDPGFCIDNHPTIPDCVDPISPPFSFCSRQTSTGNYYCYSQYGTTLYACTLAGFGNCPNTAFSLGNLNATGFTSSTTNPDFDTATNVFNIKLIPVDATLVDPFESSISPPGHRT